MGELKVDVDVGSNRDCVFTASEVAFSPNGDA